MSWHGFDGFIDVNSGCMTILQLCNLKLYTLSVGDWLIFWPTLFLFAYDLDTLKGIESTIWWKWKVFRTVDEY